MQGLIKRYLAFFFIFYLLKGGKVLKAIKRVLGLITSMVIMGSIVGCKEEKMNEKGGRVLNVKDVSIATEYDMGSDKRCVKCTLELQNKGKGSLEFEPSLSVVGFTDTEDIPLFLSLKPGGVEIETNYAYEFESYFQVPMNIDEFSVAVVLSKSPEDVLTVDIEVPANQIDTE